jgi:L-threonylcarbamoyladenylate synthase
MKKYRDEEQPTARPQRTQPNAGMVAAVNAAVEVLKQGGLILYPTDTVWGIGCDATNEAAVAKIYALKQSEDKHAMLVLCHSAEQIVRYVNRAPGIAFEVMELATSPLTLILEGAVGVAPNLIPETGTLGVRVPDHEFCQLLLRRFGRPIVSTSANISGEKTPKGLNEVVQEIVDGVDYVVNPRFQGHPTGKPSSIIAFGEGGEVRVIR